jgi:anti-anti-sigma regulatory factor
VTSGVAPPIGVAGEVFPGLIGINEGRTMKIEQLDHESLSVLTITGSIGSAETAELRSRLLAAVSGGRDVVLDTLGVSTFDDEALDALIVARSRAKYLRHRIVVVDAQVGAVCAALRRSGLYYRFPVHPDVAAAVRGLAEERAARGKQNFAFVLEPHHAQEPASGMANA